MGNFIATKNIYIDISANSAQISVDYSLLHVACPHGCCELVHAHTEFMLMQKRAAQCC